ncbi:hypothetical protein HK100_011527 [Physocladia obscura]|uniref:Uncharacterized protein n=1 Tax=Physocladia obscura TaxID=109957 RepID=A0AAD5XGJ7_9FUNG|nr:hypothetical protein HK100_011527 [Physocladia obscura]
MQTGPTRTASHAGSWYSADGDELAENLDSWLAAAAITSNNPRIRAVIAPHAGFAYSGSTAAHAYLGSVSVRTDTVVVLGPSHHTYLDGCALSLCAEYATPLGPLKVDANVNAALNASGLFGQMDRATDEDEHSIEMHLPFIKKLLSDVRPDGNYSIVPILVGNLSPTKATLYGGLLAPYLATENILVVVSSDFCHWGKRFSYSPRVGYPETPIYKYIESLDKQAMTLIEQQNFTAFSFYLTQTKNTICGRNPILLLLHTIAAVNKSKGLEETDSLFEITFTKYAQSSKVVDPRDSSVSYASAICYLK